MGCAPTFRLTEDKLGRLQRGSQHWEVPCYFLIFWTLAASNSGCTHAARHRTFSSAPNQLNPDNALKGTGTLFFGERLRISSC